MTEEANIPNNLGESLKEWWNSDDYIQMQMANEESLQRAIGKYFMLSEADKMDMVQAITAIICKAEKEGTSHRGLMDALGIYPYGFGCDFLSDIHNAVYTYYHDKKLEKELEEDIKNLQDFMET